MRRTKIVCTIGPASESLNTVMDMMRAGMDVARLNFSHGSLVEHETRIRRIREACRKTGKNVGILMDTRGPEIRIGTFIGGGITLVKGNSFTLTTDAVPGDRDRVSVTYRDIVKDVKIGSRVLLDDGLIKLKVVEVTDKEVHCVVEYGGELSNRKGVNIPGVSLNLPPMCEKDKSDILYGISQDLDFVAASFIRKASDVLEIRHLMEQNNGRMHIIAKIENEEGVRNIDEILEVSDGIMVARGDLGVEIPAEDVPIVQKIIIKKCNQAGKPVVTATQMLDSMIRNPRPTRAEASDVANAIFDGTDAVMLSGESAIGLFPIESIKTMDSIAVRAESALEFKQILTSFEPLMNKTVTDAISYATCHTAQELGASAVLTSTQSGHTARMVSKYKPQAPIIAVTPNYRVVRLLTLTWGVYPILCKVTENTDEMFDTAIAASLKAKLVQNGDLVVITAGVPVGAGTTNLLKVHTIGQIILKGTGIGKKAVTGRVFKAAGPKEVAQIQEGEILVTYETDKEYMPYLQKAGAIIVEAAGMTSHSAIVGLNLNIPVIVGAIDAMKILKNGAEVSVDSVRGLIYRGRATIL
ncbi:pyruvate kinase [Candidatus Contubernalis alkaliaceticus]|uniref:pyruvate kinase n=1 Tax=Candidatus Contubernalis alkaliaceticus TaxID=338645 RepID=UPI001F4BE901|nr:pyruvate kinase [Candidatus Contubernalis alkalaceticus]UNC91539.1 pyruvate kinase [Candidatus Contubernalis alkalaceticus]